MKLTSVLLFRLFTNEKAGSLKLNELPKATRVERGRELQNQLLQESISFCYFFQACLVEDVVSAFR